ncbi:MAG: hypothetical protein U9Q71_03295 [Pseudomonadota bacterium]|nr:hypothetical protein [Pseudomonadota bacterium]
MTSITNDLEFRQALDSLDVPQQRALGVEFVTSVLSLSDDPRVARALEVARRDDVSKEELADVFKAAKGASIDSHTRCGADGDWFSQAGYFVARAASAVAASEGQGKAGGPAWQAAMNSRMARTCESIDSGDESAASDEGETQYRLLEQYLDSVDI